MTSGGMKCAVLMTVVLLAALPLGGCASGGNPGGCEPACSGATVCIAGGCRLAGDGGTDGSTDGAMDGSMDGTMPRPDGGPGEGGAPDAADAAALRSFGDPCSDQGQCLSHICIAVGVGGLCTIECTAGTCPMGFGCIGVRDAVEGGIVSEVCVPENNQICSPCVADSECAVVGRDLCLDYATGGRFCARDCASVGCPMGYTCEDVMVSGSPFRQCIPASGACDCDGTTMGGTRACTIMTPLGTCAAQRTCMGGLGWSLCEPPSSTDTPDSAYADDNCDGIDGTLARGILISTTTGSDTPTCGLDFPTPCATIGHGITRALIEARRDLFVQAGNYNEVVVLQNGMNLYGGYDATWQRDQRTAAGHRTAIVGAVDPSDGLNVAVRASGLVVPSTLADLVVIGPDATTPPTGPAPSTYAVHLVGCSAGVNLDRITIQAGRGAAGAAGVSGADAAVLPATAPMRGRTGGAAREFSASCDTTSRGAGGAPGANSCGAGASPAPGRGGAGGAMDTSCGFGGFCSNCSATAGLPGGNASQAATGSYGYRGGGGGTCAAGGGARAGRVRNGAAGAGGADGRGTLAAGIWLARPGTAGGAGQHGGGGGGGGGSGGCDIGIDSHGAGGGGGGAGGCAARGGGTGGGGGGGSFGLFAVNSTVAVASCDLVLGSGGSGGDGGTGGRGQSGGAQGAGGAASGDSMRGGNGAPGGHGGHGGGAGGASFGIFSSGSTITESCTFSGGSAGAGGAGGLSAPTAPVAERDGNAGTAGVPGAMANVGSCAAPAGC